MNCKFAFRLAGLAIGAGFAVILASLNCAAVAADQWNGTWPNTVDAAARIAENYNCGGRGYYDEVGQFYDFVPGWQYPPGYWLGPINWRLVLQREAVFRCHNPGIARYLAYGDGRHSARHPRPK